VICYTLHVRKELFAQAIAQRKNKAESVLSRLFSACSYQIALFTLLKPAGNKRKSIKSASEIDISLAIFKPSLESTHRLICSLKTGVNCGLGMRSYYRCLVFVKISEVFQNMTGSTIYSNSIISLTMLANSLRHGVPVVS